MKTWSRVLLLVALVANVGIDRATRSVMASSPPGVRLLRATPTGLVIEWTAPAVQIRLLDDGTTELVAKGYAQAEQPGIPHLPFATALIALPSNADPHLRIISIEEKAQPLPAPLALSPLPKGIIRDDSSRPIGGAFVPAQERPTISTVAPVALEEIGIVRGVRLVRLVLHPARPMGDRLQVIHRLRLEVRWAKNTNAPPDLSDPLLRTVRQVVLNPWDAIPATPLTSQRQPLWNPVSDGTPAALIEIESPGLYRVSYQDLEHLGFSDANPQNLRLLWGTEEVALGWEGDADALFEPEEGLIFYAEPRFSRWTDIDAYRLIADSTLGARMATRSASPSGLLVGAAWVDQLVEENHIYTPDCFCGSLPAGRDGDRWAWDDLRPDDAASSYTFQSTALNASQPATLTLWLIGYTALGANPDHRVSVELNDALLGEAEWDGKTAVTTTLPITPGVLQSGLNTLTLTLPGIPGVFVEGAWLDGFAVRYAHAITAPTASLRFEGQHGKHAYTLALTGTSSLRAFDVTDPRNVQSLTDLQIDSDTVTIGDPPQGGPRHYAIANASGLARPARIRAPETPWRFSALGEVTGADLLIISHPTFADALSPLVNLRQSQGLVTAVVNVLGIYDTWGDGRPEPEAIRAFIAEAYASWNPRPAYVLLVGDGSFDPKNYRADSSITFIPPYLADIDPWAGETAADNQYACVDGDDALPDLMLGRLPVKTAGQAQAVVAKITDYEDEPLPGGWNANVILLADDADPAGDFATSSELYASEHVTAPFTTTRHYCTGIAADASDCSIQEAEALHDKLQNDWNLGALLIQFTGHSSWQQWAAERLWHLDDLAGIHNDRRLPVVVEMTCFTSAFQRPEPTLDEELLTWAGSGAVATWGGTGLGVGTGHDHLSDGFFHAIFQEGAESVGQGALAGKIALAASGQNLDLLDTFILLGDPTLKLNRTLVPWPSQFFLPVMAQGP